VSLQTGTAYVSIKRIGSFYRVILSGMDNVESPDNTQHSQKTDIRAPGGIRTPFPASERPQSYTLDRAATGTGTLDLSFKVLHILVITLVISYILVTSRVKQSP